ncbi:MAG TPA: RHS repeat-associated core domain-containing protein, partial [Chitinophagales bacterium]|nr:RHS repeat-associated core domain-containing protein [Chitinophagales bacterium]
MSVLQNFGSDTRRTFAQGYSYDQCNRLHESKNMFATGTCFDATFSDQYRMAVDYDMNGNISTLTRTGNSATAFDDLTYHYTHADNNNRLDYITDIGTPGINDIKNQTSTSNYRYDALGRLTADASESITGIEYNNQSKVTLINKNGNITSYTYDAFGRRITKTSDNVTEWYVNDATGNTLAVYSITGSELRWKEAGIFGDKRMGLYKPNIVVDARNMMRDSLIRGYKSYQLTNHTGDVLAVVSDRKYNTADGANAEVQAANNYYPFGMVMPARTIGNSEYRYGYQGMESEDNLRGENNSYTTEFRQYDPRVGRWMSVDPKADKYAGISAYTAFLNNPLIVTDPLGDDPPVKKTFEQSMNELPTTGNGEDDPIALGDELDFLFEEKPVEQEERPAPRIRTGRPPAPVDDQFLDAFFHNEISIPRWDGGAPEEVISFEDDPEHVTGNRAEAQEFINLLGPLQTADDYYSAIEQIRDPASIFGGLSETARSGMLWRLAVYARAGGFPQVARALAGGSRILPIISAVATTTAMIDCIYENSTSSDPQIQGVGLHVRNGLCVVGGVVGVAIPFVQDPISNLLPTGRQQQDAVRQMIQENIEELRAR